MGGKISHFDRGIGWGWGAISRSHIKLRIGRGSDKRFHSVANVHINVKIEAACGIAPLWNQVGVGLWGLAGEGGMLPGEAVAAATAVVATPGVEVGGDITHAVKSSALHVDATDSDHNDSDDASNACYSSNTTVDGIKVPGVVIGVINLIIALVRVNPLNCKI